MNPVMSSLLFIAAKFLSIVVGGVFAGVLGSLTGLGGATVLVPLLTLFYGVPIIYATGASLISTIATSAGSASAYTKQKITNIKVGVGLEIATTTGAIVGSLTAVEVYDHKLQWIIYVIFGLVLLMSLIPTVQRGKYEVPQDRKADWSSKLFQLAGSYHDARLKKQVNYVGVRWWLAELIMFFAGVISGLLGIGSGALKVLGMDWAMNLPMKVTTTTSNFMIGITAATGSSIYWYEGYIQLFLAAAAAIGVLLGSFMATAAISDMATSRAELIMRILSVISPFKSISTPRNERIPKNIHLMSLFVILTSIFAPMKEPSRTPMAAAAARKSCMYPSYQ